MTKRMVIMLIVVVLVLGGIFGFNAFKQHMIHKYMASMKQPPEAVSTIKASESSWQPKIDAVGSMVARQGTDLSLQVSGIVSDLQFHSGEKVEKDQTLLRLQHADQLAKLHALEASAHIAQVNYQRDLKQLKARAVSQAQVDSDKATLNNANALAAQQRALVSYYTLKAPFAGRLGIRKADLGQYIAAGTAVVSLESLDPIYLDFYLPQQQLAQISKGQKIRVTTSSYPDKTFDGSIRAISPRVDDSTRNVMVRAQLDNPDGLLRPGMYGNVTVTAGQPQEYVTLPQTAIVYNPYGDTVYLIEHADKDKNAKGKDAKAQPTLVVKQVFVTTGPKRGDQVAVLKGVKPGDVVVTSGQVKLHNGSAITINNKIKPLDQPHPRPQEQ
jgi:RND family efflux transporter, MFP subunit